MSDFRFAISDLRLRPTPCRFIRPSATGNWQFRPGFSFAEVMFAVIILGVGFIMVAAIFPVAIQQTRMTVDESTAASVARQATAALEQLAIGSETAATGGIPLFPASGGGPPANLVSIYGTQQPPGSTAPPAQLWERLSGNLISASDPRFAWTMVYSREANSQFVRAYIFVIQQRNRTTFERTDLSTTPVNLAPRLVNVNITGQSATNAPIIELTSLQPNVAEGAIIIIAGGAAPPEAKGQVFRLGTDRGDGLYDPDPGFPIPDDVNYSASAWIIGRGYEGPNPTGPAMDVAVYTTFFSVN